MWDGSGKGGKGRKRLPRLSYITQARHRMEVWVFWPVLIVTASASVSLSGSHRAESDEQSPCLLPTVSARCPALQGSGLPTGSVSFMS